MKTFRHPGSVTALAYTPDGARLFSADEFGTVRAWNPITENHSIIHEDALEVPCGIYNLAVSPNGRWILIGCVVCRMSPIPDVEASLVFHDFRQFGRFQLASGWKPTGLRGGLGLLFSPDSRLIAGRTASNEVCLWRTTTGRLVGQGKHEGILCRPSFSPDGKTLASVVSDGARDAGLVLWDVKTLALRQTERVHYDAIEVDSIPLYSPDGRCLAVASGDKIHLHNPRSRVLAWEGALEHSSVKHIQTIAFSPDSKHLLTGGSDRQDAPIVCLWNVRAGGPVAQWDWQIGAINQVAFAPDGMTAAAAGSDRLLVVWDLDA